MKNLVVLLCFLLSPGVALAAPLRASWLTTNQVIGTPTNGQALVQSGTNTWIPVSISALASNYTDQAAGLVRTNGTNNVTAAIGTLGTSLTNLSGVNTTNLTNLIGTWTTTLSNLIASVIATNTASFDITTNIGINANYTNGARKATITQFFDCTGAAAGVGLVGIYLDQNGDGVFENKANSVGFPVAIVSIGRFQASVTLQPGAIICFTNLSSGVGGGATNVTGGGQFTKF